MNNLTKDDVELYEDGTAQKIEFFSKSTDLPLTLALIVDVSGSQDHFGHQHEKDLEVFLKEVLGPKDRVFLRLLWKPHSFGDGQHEFGRGNN